VFGAYIYPTVKPPDVVTIYISFVGTYTDTQLNQIKMDIVASGYAVPIDVTKPLFRSLRIRVSPTREIGIAELAEGIRKIAEQNLSLAFWVTVADTEVLSQQEYQQVREEEKKGWSPLPSKPILETLTGIQPMHIVLGAGFIIGILYFLDRGRR